MGLGSLQKRTWSFSQYSGIDRALVLKHSSGSIDTGWGGAVARETGGPWEGQGGTGVPLGTEEAVPLDVAGQAAKSS